MSGEITITTSGKVQKSNANLTIEQLIQTIDQAAAGFTDKTVTVPMSDTVISLSEITTLGVCIVRNTDPSNFIDLGPTVAGAIAPMVRLKAGERWEFRLKPGITLRGQSDTASVKLQVIVLEA